MISLGVVRIVRRTLPLAVVVALLAALAPPRAAEALPSGFSESVVFDGLTFPTGIAFAPDGRVFVTEQAGMVKVFDDVDDATAEVFADLSENVDGRLDRGLLGIAVNPDFPTNPWVHVLYSYDEPLEHLADGSGTASGRLSRLRASGNRSVEEDVLINDWCGNFASHAIGTLAFGPEGALYAGAGDGASPSNSVDYGQQPAKSGGPTNPCGDPPSNVVGGKQEPPTAQGGSLRAQDLRTSRDPISLDGKIIRVDPATGEGWPGNPLEDDSDANARRVIAMGLRNPFRFTLRPGTTEVWAGDVGRFNHEEINRIPAEVRQGVVPNFGWPCYEGAGRLGSWDQLDVDVCEGLYAETGSAAAVTPFFTYRHYRTTDARIGEVVPGEGCNRDGGDAVTGGVFYEDGAYPNRYDGAYFFGDYARQCLWVMLPGGSGTPDPDTIELVSTGVGGIVDLEIGPGGDLFTVDIIAGQVRRLSYTSGNQPPRAVVTADKTSGELPLTVHFDARGSRDPERGTTGLSYTWDLDGDGAFNDATGSTASRTYTEAASIRVRVRVDDQDGASATASVTIQPGVSPPRGTITEPGAGTTWKVDDPIRVSGSATRANGDRLPDSALSWSILLFHCDDDRCHQHGLDTFTGSSGSFSAPDHGYPSYLEVRLFAKDPDLLEPQLVDTLRIDPQAVDLRFESDPPGVTLIGGDDPRTAPFGLRAIVGAQVTLSAPETAVMGGQLLRFDGWSDGGARDHTITAPARPRTYRAVYVPATTGQQTPGFNDIAGHTHEDAIRRLSALEVTGGYADGSYRPDLPVNRAQMATFLTRAFSLSTVSENRFVDVVDATHLASINAIAAAGITQGCDDTGRYCPGAPVTRAQMASFLARALDLPPVTPDFRDIPPGAPHAGAIGAVQVAEITQGCATPGSFCPGQSVTRGQMASFLVRALE